MKLKFIKVKDVKEFFKEKGKQTTPDSLKQIDQAVLKVLVNTEKVLGQFKRVTEKEVVLGNQGLFK